MLAAAQDSIRAGWVQNAWYAYRDDRALHVVHGHDLGALAGREISASCLVGAIGTPAVALVGRYSTGAARPRPDLAHAARRSLPPDYVVAEPRRPLAHLRDLTGWNDQPRRTREQVVALLQAAEHAAG